MTGYALFVVATIPSFFLLMTYDRVLTEITRWVPLVEQDLFTIPKHMS